MTVFKASKVRRSLEKKGFIEENNHHKMFFLYNDEGKRLPISTKMSHNGQEINDYLISHMAKQVCLNKEQFIDLIECPLSKEQYIGILRSKGIS